VLDALKGKNLLVLDAGNALFRNAGQAAADDRARAHFVLDVMGRLGTKAMAVSVRDLSAGLDFLLAEAKRSPVKLLSCNLRRAGKAVFEASTVVSVAGLRVAVIGVSAPGPIVIDAPDVVAGPTVDGVKAALGKLGKHDLTIVLAATSFADATQLAQDFKGQVDFVLQSGEFRGTQPPQRVDGSDTFLFASGQRGQAMAKVVFEPGAGPGPVLDKTGVERDRKQLEFVGTQVAKLEARLQAATEPQLKTDLAGTLQTLRDRQAALQKAIAVEPGQRSLMAEWVVLSTEVKDDAALKQEVLKIEPTYAGAH
jgi:2',3'-cyclic-nucleotide 2'-phosphodiesterase (5'-nucleotidase family)